MKRARTHTEENGRIATAPIDDSPASGAVVTLRLIVTDEPDAAVTWQEGTPVDSLVLDLVAASGGVPVETQGPLLHTRFAGVHPACLAARRLQWAMQGLAENSSFAVPALSILVKAGKDIVESGEGGSLSELEAAPPGTILVARHAGQTLEQEPGFATRNNGQALLELQWRAPDGKATRAADEAALARLGSDLHGTAGPGPAGRSLQPEPTTVIPAPGFESERESERAAAPRRGKSGLVLGAVAVAAMSVAGFIWFHHASTPEQPAVSSNTTKEPAQPPAVAPTNTPAQSSTGSPAAGSTATPDRPDASAPPPQKLSRRERLKQEKEAKKAAAQPAKTESTTQANNPSPQPPAVPEPRGDCQYQPDQLSGLLTRAESSRAHGQYADARRKFLAVLACDRGNRRAADGLQQVLQAMKAAGSDD